MKFLTIIFVGVNHLFRALKYSASGLRACFRDEIAFRQECAMAIPHFILLFALPITFSTRVFLTFLLAILLAFELINTAIEAVVDLASPERHLLAGKAKDCASAAVFIVIISYALGWTYVLGRLVYHVFLKSIWRMP